MGPRHFSLGYGLSRNAIVLRGEMTLVVPSALAISSPACDGPTNCARSRRLCLQSAQGQITRVAHLSSLDFGTLLPNPGRKLSRFSGCCRLPSQQLQPPAMVVLLHRAVWPVATSCMGYNAVVASRSQRVLEVCNDMANAMRTQALGYFQAVANVVRCLSLDHEGGSTGGGAGGSGDGLSGGGNWSGDGGHEFPRGDYIPTCGMEAFKDNTTSDHDVHDVGLSPGEVARMIPAGELDSGTIYQCSAVEFINPHGSISDVSSWSRELVEIRPGAFCSQKDIEATVSRLLYTGWFDHVKAFFVKRSGNAIKLVFQLQGFEHPPVASCKFINVGPVFDACPSNLLGSSPKTADSLESASQPRPGSMTDSLASLTLESKVEDGAQRREPSEHQHLRPEDISSSSAFPHCGQCPLSSGTAGGAQDIVETHDHLTATSSPKPRGRLRPCLLPLSVQKEIASWLQQQKTVTVQTLSRIQKWVEEWYHSNGYNYANVKKFDGVVDGALQFNVVEGDITRLRIIHQDKGGRHVQGRTKDSVIRRELPTVVREGMQYNVGAGKAALHNIFQLNLFDNVQVIPQPDAELSDGGGVMLDVVVSERPAKCAYVDTEWSFVTTDSGRPDLSTLQPGGSLFVEQQNIGGLNRSVCASIATTNVLQPQDDLRFKLEYVHPYLDGHSSSLNRSLRAACFNKRKLGAILATGHQPTAMWVDRAGIKLSITENFTKRSKMTYGVVVEEVATRDEASVIRNNGLQHSGDGRVQAGDVVDVTTSGVDHLVFLQCKVTRDNTTFLNGMQVGAKDVFQVDQGIGVGRIAPVFNRHNLGMTRFMVLGKLPKQPEHPPCLLILHSRYGGCVGDVPRYHAFTSGGPYALRGQNEGELASSRHFLELGAEVRVPMQRCQIYAYAEMGADLSQIGDGRRLCSRIRRGSSAAGISLGLVRAEYVVESGSDSGCFKVCFGERW